MLKKLIPRLYKSGFYLHLPVNPRLILFESNGDMSDSTRVLYDRLKKNYPKKYKYVWVVGDANEYEDTKDTKFISPLPRKNPENNFKSNYYYARAKYCFYTHRPCGIKDKKTQKRVFITHGFAYKNVKGKFWDPHFNTNVIHLSDYDREISVINDISRMDISLALGYPRNDVLINGAPTNTDILFTPNKYSKIFVWLPTFKTHRIWGNSCHIDQSVEDFSLIQEDSLNFINSILKQHNALMIIKHHPAQDLNRVVFKNYTNILMFSNDDFLSKNVNLYGLLAESDALITDFSSVFTDYLLTDKPIAFDLSGYDNYASGDGFCVDDPISLLPGRLVYTTKDLKKFIEDTINGIDEFIDRRKAEKNKLHKYQDGKSTERILTYFGLIK